MTALGSRGEVEGVSEGIRDNKTICFAYAIKDRQQERGCTCQQRCPAFRGAFESVSGSRVGADGKGSRLREVWSRPQLSPLGGVEESPESVVADGEQEPVGVPFGENAARAARLMSSFHGAKLARGCSVRVGEMVRAILELPMVYGERVCAWDV